MNNKSDKTIAAAQKLIDTRFFTESVHCSYYAVFQLMMYKLANAINSPMSYEEQKEKAKAARQSSHENILLEYKKRLGISPKDEKKLTNEFRWLKEKRQKADYSDNVFSSEDGLECKKIAEGLIYKLKHYTI